MADINIYVEGGESPDSKRALRLGLNVLLGRQLEIARRHRHGWNIIFCGSRRFPYERFCEDIERGRDTLPILLVDSEDPVVGTGAVGRVNQLVNRPADRWTDLNRVPPERVHLMIQSMESWIVADPDALERYYNGGFKKTALPVATNLETVSKIDVANALKDATKPTKKGRYHEIEHGAKLLALLDPAKLEKRCPGFLEFTSWLDKTIPAL